MRTRLLAFVDALRDSGVPITVAETLDAMQAVGVLGIEPGALREGLATALVKDYADRPTYDAVFDRFFAVPGHRRGKGERPQPTGEGVGGGRGVRGTPAAGAPPQQPQPNPARRSTEQKRDGSREADARKSAADGRQRQRLLRSKPFHEMSAPEIEACEVLVAELAQRLHASLHRRERAARRGRFDVRRTLRRSMSMGGVPLDPAYRRRYPRRPDLVALCDLSYSVATASRFLVALLAPAEHYFRRVRLFAFVDQPVEFSVESGTFVPHDRLDLHARSDFGNALVTFWRQHETLLTRNTILLILGDARNNRRPPRADLLGRMHAAAKRTVWLNPEPRSRWDTGDSVMRLYHRHCDTVLAAGNVRELYTALRAVLRVL